VAYGILLLFDICATRKQDGQVESTVRIAAVIQLLARVRKQ
jgi:hypothetical protein